MKLLDSLVERSLLSSKKFVAAVKAMYDVAGQMQRLAKNVLILSKDVQRHEMILGELYRINKELAKGAHQDTFDVSLSKPKTDAEKKPN